MFITGVGRTKFGELIESMPELIVEAMSKAIEDAAVDFADIDAIYISNFAAGPFISQLHLGSLVASLITKFDIPVIRIEAACASGGAAIYQALLSLHKFRHVMVIGVEKMTGPNAKSISKFVSMASDASLDQAKGVIFPASYALVAQQHMLKYGTTLEDLALVSFKNHRNANLNPLAHFYQKRVALEDIMESPVVSTPLRLFDCSPVSDGAAAIILSREKKSDRDIRVLASTLAMDTLSLTERRDLTCFAGTRRAAARAYAEAALGPADIDFIEVHDCFTIAELIALEDLGFCRPGESTRLTREGQTSLDGTLPVNPSGGLKANGHPIGASGVSQACEIATQLRGEAGDRQVASPEVGLMQNVGGVGGTVSVHIFRREQ